MKLKHINKDTLLCFFELLLLTLLVMLMTSCHHKDLCYHHPHYVDVYVSYDWQHDPEADPEHMSVLFFQQGGWGDDATFTLNGKTGGKVSLLVGDYLALSYNSDTENMLFRNTKSMGDAEVYAKDATVLESIRAMAQSLPRSKAAQEQRMVMPCEKMWADHLEQPLHLTMDDSQLGKTLEAKFFPHPLYCEYTVEIRNAQNLSGLGTLLGASLSGLSSGAFLNSREPNKDVATVPFDMAIADRTTLKGEFLTFGYNAQLQPEHHLVVYAVLADGSKWYYDYDVTAQVHLAPDPRHVHIIVDGLTIPTPAPSTSPGGIGVEDWKDISTDIIF